MEPPSSNSYGSNYAAYTSETEYQNIFNGYDTVRWAFLVNAEKYPNWTRIAKAEYFDEGNPFPAGENGWIPASVRYTATDAYKAPFGNTTWGRTSDTSKNGRTYLIYEKHGDPCTMLLFR